MDGRSALGILIVLYIAIFVVARCDISSATGGTTGHGASAPAAQVLPCDA